MKQESIIRLATPRQVPQPPHTAAASNKHRCVTPRIPGERLERLVLRLSYNRAKIGAVGEVSGGLKPTPPPPVPSLKHRSVGIRNVYLARDFHHPSNSLGTVVTPVQMRNLVYTRPTTTTATNLSVAKDKKTSSKGVVLPMIGNKHRGAVAPPAPPPPPPPDTHDDDDDEADRATSSFATSSRASSAASSVHFVPTTNTTTTTTTTAATENNINNINVKDQRNESDDDSGDGRCSTASSPKTPPRDNVNVVAPPNVSPSPDAAASASYHDDFDFDEDEDDDDVHNKEEISNQQGAAVPAPTKPNGGGHGLAESPTSLASL
eukprot:PhM_4_TR3507/c1_g1_i1/m.5933